MSISPFLTPVAARLRSTDCELDAFVRTVGLRTRLADFPLAAAVVDNVLVYDAERLRTRAPGRTATRRSLPSWCAPSLTAPAS